MAEEIKKAVKAAPKKAAAKKAEAPKEEVSETKYVNRLQKKYREEIGPALVKEFGYTSVMQAPKL